MLYPCIFQKGRGDVGDIGNALVIFGFDAFDVEAGAEGDTPGSLTINGTLVPPSYSLVLNPDSGEAEESAPHAA
jgi:hypothetical protein